MTRDFAAVLAELRRRAGFKTPNEFFSKSGGRKVLGMSGVNYWKIERGRALPKPDRVIVLVACLHLPPSSPEVQELVRAYLRGLLGSDTAFDWMSQALAGREPPGRRSVGDHALMRRVEEDLIHLTPEQNRALLADYEGYWAFTVLSNDERAWPVADLAKRLKVGRAALDKALRRLDKAKVLKLVPDGKARCPFVGKLITFLPDAQLTPADQLRLREYHARMVKAQGTLVKQTFVLPRARDAEIAFFFPHLTKAVTESHAFSVTHGGPGSSLYMVEGLVHRLFEL